MFVSRFLQYTFIFLFLTYGCHAANGTNYEIVVTEFGAHVPAEELSFAAKGFIPPFVPLYTVNVTHSRTDLDPRFTYLRVEYLSPMSTLKIIYEPENSSLTFHIVFPFMNIPYGIIGYSVKHRPKLSYRSSNPNPSSKNQIPNRYSRDKENNNVGITTI